MLSAYSILHKFNSSSESLVYFICLNRVASHTACEMSSVVVHWINQEMLMYHLCQIVFFGDAQLTRNETLSCAFPRLSHFLVLSCNRVLSCFRHRLPSTRELTLNANDVLITNEAQVLSNSSWIFWGVMRIWNRSV